MNKYLFQHFIPSMCRKSDLNFQILVSINLQFSFHDQAELPMICIELKLEKNKAFLNINFKAELRNDF